MRNRWHLGANRQVKVEWDFEDRLVKVVKADGTVVENVYDVDGVLVRTVVGGVATDLLVDMSGGLSHVVAESDGSGGVTALYVRAGDMLLEEIRGGVAKMYETDGLGSVRSLLDTSGARTDTYSYTAFGELLSKSGTDENPYQFAGERFEEAAGMYQNRERWLDTRTGRFVSVDPLLDVSGSSYGYSSQDPVNRIDPTGTIDTLTGLMAGIAATFVVGCATPTPAFTKQVATAAASGGGTLFLYNNLIDFHSANDRAVNALIDRFEQMYQEQLIPLVEQIVGASNMRELTAKRVTKSTDIQSALRTEKYSRVVYFGHVDGDNLAPDWYNDRLSSLDFASAARRGISDISLIGCYSLNFARPLRTQMVAWGNPATNYWGTSSMVFQEIAELWEPQMVQKGKRMAWGRKTTGVTTTKLWMGEGNTPISLSKLQ